MELVPSADGSLLVVSAGRWGRTGANGGTCAFNAAHQQLAGSIVVDSVSSLDLVLSDSTFQGCINADGQAGDVSVTLDSGSSWTLTANSYASSFSGSTSCVHGNGYHLYVNGKQVV